MFYASSPFKHFTFKSALLTLKCTISLLEPYTNIFTLPAARVSVTPHCHSLPLRLGFLVPGLLSVGCIALVYAWRSHTMKPAHLILPKSQWGVLDTRAAGSM